jgi:DnaK suppressor protein
MSHVESIEAALADRRDESIDGRVAVLTAQQDRSIALIRDLKEELAAIAESTAAGPDDEHDAEGSTVAYERARVQALLALAEHTASELAAAAEQATSGAVAICERCQIPIPLERLVALPTTRICVACARLG